MNREVQSAGWEAQEFDAALHPALKLRLARERIFFGPDRWLIIIDHDGFVFPKVLPPQPCVRRLACAAFGRE